MLCHFLLYRLSNCLVCRGVFQRWGSRRMILLTKVNFRSLKSSRQYNHGSGGLQVFVTKGGGCVTSPMNSQSGEGETGDSKEGRSTIAHFLNDRGFIPKPLFLPHSLTTFPSPQRFFRIANVQVLYPYLLPKSPLHLGHVEVYLKSVERHKVKHRKELGKEKWGTIP